MFRKLVPLAIASLWGVVLIPLPQRANASTPLTRAVVKKLHNWVQLIPQNRPKRRAKRRDSMNPGDGLATGRASLADLRFNDGSLARIGERAVFRFLPRSRTFRLSNGTVLLLIPPGQGQTRVRTRSAAATIRGSALFVRYDEQTDTTVVGSLTDSGIEVFNKDESRSQVLKAGQLIVVVKGRIEGLYNFDLRTFYDTSDLVRGLDLTKSSDTTSSDSAMASVQAETSEALALQEPIVGDKVVENPSFIELSPVSSDSPGEEVGQTDLPVNTLVDTGQVIRNTLQENDEDKSPSNDSNAISPQAPTPASPTTPKPATPTTPTIPATPSNPPKTGNGTPTPTPTIPATPSNPPTTGNGTPTPTPTNPANPATPTNPPTTGGGSPEPELPTPEPELPTPEPELPTPEPELPTPEPELPTPEPELPTPEPELPT
ncbi:MAG: FecR family protein, partial [Rivularia sp. (in: cyanobacteria)]